MLVVKIEREVQQVGEHWRNISTEVLKRDLRILRFVLRIHLVSPRLDVLSSIFVSEQRTLVSHARELLVIILPSDAVLVNFIACLIDAPVGVFQQHNADEGSGSETKTDAEASWVAWLLRVEKDIL